MLQRIQNMNKGLADGESGANLYPSHVFRFDFLNGSFDTLPAGLRAILNDPEKRKKLVLYINPPYAEAATSRTKTRTGENKPGVADHALNKQYRPLIGAAVNELFALFLMRIHEEIPGCVVGQFSTLKHLQAPNFKDFREHFHARLCRSFIVPADTFDNVSGKFPIGFFVWRLSEGNEFNSDEVDVYDRKGNSIGAKTICAISRANVINRWLHGFLVANGTPIGWLRFVPNDFQNNSGVYLTLKPKDSDVQESRVAPITKENCTVIAMYLAIRNSVESTWLNNRDQFLYPKDTWKEDTEFQRNCLVYTLFHGQNRIRSADGPNHWVPFPEEEIGTKDEIKSHFMIDLLAGKGGKRHVQGDLFETGEGASRKPVLSSEARAVLEAAKGLYRYYHSLPEANPDASFYDIRLRFQKTDDRGRMNPSSDDETYNALLASLRSAQKALAARIAQGVCRHGFLK